MLHDIVARLRDYDFLVSDAPPYLRGLIRIAADEIEQLRARVAELENKMSHDELLDKLIDPQLVWVDTTTKTVDIIDLPNGRGIYDRENPYFIRFEQLDSVCAFMRWLRHLAEKGWFTGMHVEQFSQCYELLLRNEIVPQRIYGKQLETDPEDLEHSSEP